MVRFYSNENFALSAVNALRRLGHDVLTSVKAGQANRRVPDEAVVRFASADGRAVLTFNHRDFAHEHRRSAAHAGIVSCTVDADSDALASRIHAAVSGMTDLSGRFIRITRGSGT